MMVGEHLGFDAIDAYLGQAAGTSYVNIAVFDSGADSPIAGAQISIVAGAQQYGGNTNDTGTTTVAVGVAPNTPTSVIVYMPGYQTARMTVNSDASATGTPTQIMLDPFAPTATVPLPGTKPALPPPPEVPATVPTRTFAPAPAQRSYTPSARPMAPSKAPSGAPSKSVVAAAGTESNLTLYLALGLGGIVAIGLVFMLTGKKTAA